MWLQSLAQDSPILQQEENEIKRLENAIKTWTLPIQEYLINPTNYQLQQNQFRTCFILHPPTPGEINWGHLDWKLKYYLQAIDDLDLLIEADKIWQNPVEHLDIADRIIDDPQETLLKGLGLAARLYNPIATSLQEQRPLQCLLNPIEVYEFVRASAWQLQDHGLGVILPTGLASGAGERRLGINIKADVSRKKGERLGLQTLLKYKLELAIGKQNISKKILKNYGSKIAFS